MFGLGINNQERIRYLLHGHSEHSIIRNNLASKSNRKINLLKTKSRVKKFEQDFPIFLISLSSSIKCGNDPLSALFTCKELFSKNSIIYKSIRDTQEEIEQGLNEVTALRRFALNIKHPDLTLFREAFILSRLHGASLSACLQRIAKVVRSRQSFRRKTKAAIAMQKLSAIGIFVAVLALILIQFVSAKDILISTVSHPIGIKLLILASTLIFFGLIFLFRVSKLKSL